MKPTTGLTEVEKIARFASLLFALFLLCGSLYLLFTRIWVLYFFAVCNILVISVLAFLTLWELYKMLRNKE